MATEKPQGDAAVPRWIVMPSPQELVDTVTGRCLIYGLLSARALRKLLERQLLELSQQLLNQRSKCRPVPVTVAS
jgi:hypothetical protein